MAKRRRILRKVIGAFAPKYTKLSPYAFGHALGILSIIGVLFYAIMTWLGDYNPSVFLQQYPIPFTLDDWTLLIGIIETYVISYMGGWIFVKIYNMSSR